MARGRCEPSHSSPCRSPCRYRSSCPTCRSNCWDCESSPLARICERKFELEAALWCNCAVGITCFLVDCANEPRSNGRASGIWVERGASMMQCSAARHGKSPRTTHATFFRMPPRVTASIASALRTEKNEFSENSSGERSRKTYPAVN